MTISRPTALVPVLIAALGLLVGCDKSGIHPLHRKRDVVGACTTPAATWMRSTDTGTEILLIGDRTSSGVVTLADDRCFAHGTVERDSSTQFAVGKYVLDANGEGSFVYDAEFRFDYQPERKILDRDGSIRTDHSPPLTENLALQADGSTLLVTLGGETHRYESLYTVIHRLDPDTMEGASDILRVFLMPQFTSQARLLGFGSAGMTQYAGSPGTFKGLVQNQFTVLVEDTLRPNTFITFTNFEDLTGVVEDGEQDTYVNLLGDGHMRNELHFLFYGSRSITDIAYSGTVEYGDLEIKNGVAGGGFYTMNLDGHGSYQLPYTLAANVDLTAVLPPLTP
ncbi:MAG: hypothetical protein U0230_10040 [Polyangiales bacterium]